MADAHARPGLGNFSNRDDDHAVDEWDGETVWSYQTRARLRETSQAAHALMVDRLRNATRQGAAASPGGLAAEIVELHRAITASRTAHGAAHSATMQRVRVAYLEVAASALVLAERATRPAELQRGAKSSTARYAPPRFEVKP